MGADPGFERHAANPISEGMQTLKEEHDIVGLVLAAQADSQAADSLIEQYLPFIKSETAKSIGRFPSQEDDELSIAMFAFYEAICSYQPGKGGFLKLAALAIRNRLIDYRRKQVRHEGNLSLETPVGPEDDRTLAEQLPDERMAPEEHQDRMAAQQEIAHFTQQLSGFGLSLTDIAENCPKQERTLAACMEVLDYARKNPELLEQLISTGKLPMAQLSKGTGVEKKTLERHRKYLVAILLAYTNGFEIIRGHLQMIKRKEAAL